MTAIVVGLLAVASPAAASHSGCGTLGLSKCPHAVAPPRTPAPDPGGDEAHDLRLPLQEGKLFGFNTMLSLGGLSTPAAEVAYGRTVGATAQRYSVSWRGLQPHESSPVLPKPGGQESHYLLLLDGLYEELRLNGMTPVISFGSAPLWATDYAKCGLLDDRCKQAQKAGQMHPARSRAAAFGRFVAAVAGRYPDAVIEPWNEPNIVPFWRPDAPDPYAYAALQCSAYRAVKALPRPNLVTSGGFAAFWTTRADGSPGFESYLDRAYGAGIGKCIDGFNVHMYPANKLALGAGSPFAEQFAIVRRQRQKHRDDTPIWITETGATSFPNSATHTWGMTEAQQADVNARLLNKLATMPDVHAVLFHTLRNAPLEGWAGRWREPGYNYGFLRENFAPKPVWCRFVLKAGSSSPGC